MFAYNDVDSIINLGYLKQDVCLYDVQIISEIYVVGKVKTQGISKKMYKNKNWI